MADPTYPYEDHLFSNFEELFERLSIEPKDNKPGNFNGYIVENLVVSAVASVTVRHQLKRIPTGYFIIKKNAAVDVYHTDIDDESIEILGTGTATITLLVL